MILKYCNIYSFNTSFSVSDYQVGYEKRPNGQFIDFIMDYHLFEFGSTQIIKNEFCAFFDEVITPNCACVSISFKNKLLINYIFETDRI